MSAYLNLPTLLALASLAGLMIGSFVNVVIARMPILVRRRWQRELLQAAEIALLPMPTYNLAWPRSRCPHCQHSLRWFELIPLLSYLMQAGKCRACGAAISMRYPLIELLCAALFAAAAARFGLTSDTILVCLLLSALVALAAIDLDTQMLPDAITQPLLWTGLAAGLVPVLVPLEHAVVGITAGYLALRLPAQLVATATGRPGLGEGDIKLAAALGAWLGQGVIVALLIATLINLGCHAVLRKPKIPMGPALGLATAVVVLAPETPGVAWMLHRISFL